MRRDIKSILSVAAIAASLTVGAGTGRADTADLKACRGAAQQDAKIDCYTHILDDQDATPENRAGAYSGRSMAFDSKGEYERAIADAANALEINPEYQRAYFARGSAYHHKGEADLAIADYDRAIAIAPRDADSLINRAILYDRKGDHNGAIREFDAVLAMDSAKPLLSQIGHSLAYLNRGVAHLNRGEIDDAIADAGKAIEFDPKFASAYNNRGIAYQRKGEFGPAFVDFDKAIELNPTHTFFYYTRGLAHRSKGEFGPAIVDFQKAVELDSKYKAAQVELGRTYVEAGKAVLSGVRNWITGG